MQFWKRSAGLVDQCTVHAQKTITRFFKLVIDREAEGAGRRAGYAALGGSGSNLLPSQKHLISSGSSVCTRLPMG